MKRTLITLILLVSAVSFAGAQGRGGTPEERATASMDRLPATLNLTADQKTKVTALYVAQAKSQDEARAAANGDFQSMLPKIAAITADTDTKVLALLSDTQKPQYQAYMSSRPAAGGRGGAGAAAGGRGGSNPASAGQPGVPPPGQWDGGGVFPGGGTFVPRGGQ